MNNSEAIEAIKYNYPPENCTMLREALDMAIELLSKAPEEGEENLGLPKLMDVYRRVQNKSTYIVTGIDPDTEEVRIDGTAYSLTQFHANFKKD